MCSENLLWGKLLIDYTTPTVLPLPTLLLGLIMFQTVMIQAEKTQCCTQTGSNPMQAET